MNKLYPTTSNSVTKDFVCFSHLRWNFVYQRPQHLLSRFAKHFRVFFVEEPIFHESTNNLQVTLSEENVWIIVPHLNNNLSEEEKIDTQKDLLNKLFRNLEIESYLFWYYTPMALAISDHFEPELVIYDCMDELAAFKFAPPQLRLLEAKLFQKADLIFTGGHSLYEVKKALHANIFAFPSSIEKEHFSLARQVSSDPADQQPIPHPRIGFFGVIDERMNIDLIAKIAQQKPNWHFVMIGPVVKIDPADLPRLHNIHYLGGKTYKELPAYLAGWEIAMIPFALNESTQFISPTKTPEYLSAGKPVISTSITDVVNPYGINKMVAIADTPEEFISCIEDELSKPDKSKWLEKVDEFLSDNSWDNTWKKMLHQIIATYNRKHIANQNTKEQVYV
ncbi:MAG: glycosyltransferase family 1 protein [Chitinophagaceae bacterium]|nr:glycosyltransferase family 1 protein [Chitinophagaceae bacterium]